MHNAGTGLQQRSVNSLHVRVLLQQLTNPSGVERLAPRQLVSHDLDAKPLPKNAPSLGEFPRFENDRFPTTRKNARDRGLHPSGAGRRHDDDLVFGLKHIFQVRTDLIIQPPKLVGPVMRYLLSERKQRILRDLRRPRCH